MQGKYSVTESNPSRFFPLFVCMWWIDLVSDGAWGYSWVTRVSTRLATYKASTIIYVLSFWPPTQHFSIKSKLKICFRIEEIAQ